MTATLKAQYSSLQTFTYTSALGLATNTGATPAYVDNTTNLYDEILIFLKVTFVGDPGDSWISLGAYTSLDHVNFLGSEFGVDGTDKVITVATPPDNITNQDNTRFVTVLGKTTATYCTTLSQLLQQNQYTPSPQAVPPYWGIFMWNGTNSVFSSTAGNLKLQYMGMYSQAI